MKKQRLRSSATRRKSRQALPARSERPLVAPASTQLNYHKIVPEDSAHIPGYGFETINANHTEMCKFSSKDDPNYKVVVQLLKKWMEEVKEASRVKETQNVSGVKNH